LAESRHVPYRPKAATGFSESISLLFTSNAPLLADVKQSIIEKFLFKKGFYSQEDK